MLLFRSEDHVDEWLQRTARPRGATLTVEQMWELAGLWYARRMEPGWKRPPPAEAEAIFASVGLSGDFWRLT